MTKKALPPCSKSGCNNAADIVIAGLLLCAEHATEALGQRGSPQLKVAKTFGSFRLQQGAPLSNDNFIGNPRQT